MVGARAGLTDLGYAITENTLLMTGADHAIALVDAGALFAALGWTTVHVVTGRQAEAIPTGLTVLTFGVDGAQGATCGIQAEFTVSAGPVEVDHTIAVVIDSIADLHWVRAAVAAAVSLMLIDPTITVIIRSIAELLGVYGDATAE